MARRFNIGDKVIKFKPSYYMNTFIKTIIEYGIVTDADDDRFTTQGKLSSFDSGRNYHECFQTGKLVYGYNEGETFWFNMTTEMDLIEDYHKKVQEQFLMERQNQQRIRNRKDSKAKSKHWRKQKRDCCLWRMRIWDIQLSRHRNILKIWTAFFIRS